MAELFLVGTEQQSADWSKEPFVVNSAAEVIAQADPQAHYADIYVRLPAICSVCGAETPDYVWIAGGKTFCAQHAPLVSERKA